MSSGIDRTNIAFTFILSIVINIGMWIERFVIIVTSLSHDRIPSSWQLFFPSWFDLGVFVFSIGLFLSIGVFLFSFLLLIRFLPIINMYEVKTTIKK